MIAICETKVALASLKKLPVNQSQMATEMERKTKLANRIENNDITQSFSIIGWSTGQKIRQMI